MSEVPGQATSVAADPVSRITAMLESEHPEQKVAETQQTEESAQTEEDAGKNAQVEGEEHEQTKVAEIPLDQLEAIELEVEITGDNGKVTEKKPIKELKLGYMRQADYQRKTAEVARQREEVGQKVRQGIESERTQYLQTLQQMESALVDSVAPELKDVNWNTLANENPGEYVRLRNRADQIATTLKAVQAKQQEVRQQQTAEQSQARQTAASKARETLEADIPGWNDALYHTLMKTGESHGFKAEEVGTWIDPRAIKLLHKAHLYDQLQKPSNDKKVVVPPKVIKPGVTEGQTRQKGADAMKRLQTSGKLSDAADLIASRM